MYTIAAVLGEMLRNVAARAPAAGVGRRNVQWSSCGRLLTIVVNTYNRT